MAETAPIPTAAAAETPAGETRSRARPRGPAAARAPSPQVAGRKERAQGTRDARGGTTGAAEQFVGEWLSGLNPAPRLWVEARGALPPFPPPAAPQVGGRP